MILRVILQSLAFLLVFVRIAPSGHSAYEKKLLANCPCGINQSHLCLPLSSVMTKKKEVFAFSVQNLSDTKGTLQNWRYYDWDVVTTIAWNLDKELLCYAHKRKVRIVVKHNFDHVMELCDASARQRWTKSTYRKIAENYADGVNIDTEKPVSGKYAKCQTLLIKELRQELNLHSFTKNAQISFDVPWSPNGIDGRYYDWKGLAKYSDFLFAMSYDLRSQVYDHCIAGSNSPLAQVEKGIQNYLLEYNIPPEKLILGVPWYGYIYPCLSTSDNFKLCSIKQVPYHGAPCSDAAANYSDYSAIIKWIHRGADVKWDNLTQSPWFMLHDSHGGYFQVWFDNPKSLMRKYQIAVKFRLKGIGMWNADSLDYSGQNQPLASTRMMWKLIHSIFHEKVVAPVQRIY